MYLPLGLGSEKAENHASRFPAYPPVTLPVTETDRRDHDIEQTESFAASFALSSHVTAGHSASRSEASRRDASRDGQSGRESENEKNRVAKEQLIEKDVLIDALKEENRSTDALLFFVSSSGIPGRP